MLQTFVAMVPFGIAIGMFAQADAMVGWERSAMQLGALGILGFVIAWIVKNVLPGMVQSHNETTREITKQFTATISAANENFTKTVDAAFSRIDKNQEASDASQRELTEALRQLTANCAAMRSQRQE